MCNSKEEALLSTAIREVKKIYDRAKMSKQDGYLPFMGGVWKHRSRKKIVKKLFQARQMSQRFRRAAARLWLSIDN